MNDAALRHRGRFSVWAIFVCLCCTLPYWRSLGLPPISDDYLQIWLGRKYFQASALPELAADTLYRCRATSIWLTGLTEYLFGASQFVFNVQSILLHALNVGLIIGLGRFAPFTYRLMIPAAILWGFNERHHEAVMWYASLPEQLVFTFLLLTVMAWLSWWRSGASLPYVLSLLSFILALLSKESAVVGCALLFIPVLFDLSGLRRALVASLPFLSLSVLYFALNMASRQDHLHWNDGTFVLGWHFLPVMANSALRLLTFWGAAAILYLLWTRQFWNNRFLLLALVWIPITLAPYAFVAYQPRVPSRHVYMASLGVALLLSLAVNQLFERKRLLSVLLSAYVLFNTSYIWFFKHEKFQERAEITEKLIEDARAVSLKFAHHPLQVHCFPLAPDIARIAIEDKLAIPAKLIFVEKAASPACGPVTVDAVLD